MKLLVVHLSDAHIKEFDDQLFRYEKIADAIRANHSAIDHILLVFSGDIVFSGLRHQFDYAELVLDSITKELVSHYRCPVTEFWVPGNHDCDFTDRQQMRQMVLEHVNGRGMFDLPDEPMVETATSVQDEYFKFHRKRMGESRNPVGAQRLSWKRDLMVGSHSVQIFGFNSAVLSRKDEVYGSLSVFVPPDIEPNADLTIGVFHHPARWLLHSLQRAFTRKIEEICDVILTGHEHDPQLLSVRSAIGSVTRYVEGGVLSEPSMPKISSFNTIEIDLESSNMKVIQFELKNKIYEVYKSSPQSTIKRTEPGIRKRFELTQDFERFLNRPGTAFTHPRRSDVSFADLFCSVSLMPVTKVETTALHIPLEDIGEKEGYTLILGDELSGRTSIGKHFFEVYADRGKVPIWINGSEVNLKSKNGWIDLINNSVQSVYGRTNPEEYRQLEKNKRAVIIDDIEECGLSVSDLNSFLSYLIDHYSCVTILSTTSYPFEQRFQEGGDVRLLSNFDAYKISPLGPKQRSKLIERWYMLGREHETLQAQDYQNIKQLEQNVKELLGNSIVPKYPVFVYTILQSLEAVNADTATVGTYGYYYQRLINEALDKYCSKNQNRKGHPSPEAMIVLLGRLAYVMFTLDKRVFSREDMDRHLQAYCEEYDKYLRPELVWQPLVQAQILTEKEDDQWSFSYNYVYYYFVASYLSEHLYKKKQKANVRQTIEFLVDRLHNEANASILVFFVYLSRDEDVLELLVKKANSLFSDMKECDIRSDLKRFNELESDFASLKAHKSAGEHMEEIRSQAEDLEMAEELEDSDLHDRDSDINRIATLNVSFKCLQVLGQIIRNSPGGLDAAFKEDATTACFKLGLRSLSFINNLISENMNAFKDVHKKVLSKELSVKNVSESLSKIDKFVFGICNMCCYGVVRHTSVTIGSRHLEKTYNRIGDLGTPVASELFKISIYLNHFDRFPEKEIEDLSDLCIEEKNFIGFSILQHMLINSYYSVSIDPNVWRKVSKKLQIGQESSAVPLSLRSEDSGRRK